MSIQSNKALKEIKPRTRSLRGQVLTLLSEGSVTFQQVSKKLYMKPQTTSARLSELHDEGLIYQDEYGLYNLTASSDVEFVKTQRETIRFQKWKALGNNNGWFLTKWGDELTECHSGTQTELL